MEVVSLIISIIGVILTIITSINTFKIKKIVKDKNIRRGFKENGKGFVKSLNVQIEAVNSTDAYLSYLPNSKIIFNRIFLYKDVFVKSNVKIISECIDELRNEQISKGNLITSIGKVKNVVEQEIEIND